MVMGPEEVASIIAVCFGVALIALGTAIYCDWQDRKRVRIEDAQKERDEYLAWCEKRAIESRDFYRPEDLEWLDKYADPKIVGAVRAVEEPDVMELVKRAYPDPPEPDYSTTPIMDMSEEEWDDFKKSPRRPVRRPLHDYAAKSPENAARVNQHLNVGPRFPWEDREDHVAEIVRQKQEIAKLVFDSPPAFVDPNAIKGFGGITIARSADSSAGGPEGNEGTAVGTG